MPIYCLICDPPEELSKKSLIIEGMHSLVLPFPHYHNPTPLDHAPAHSALGTNYYCSAETFEAACAEKALRKLKG